MIIITSSFPWNHSYLNNQTNSIGNNNHCAGFVVNQIQKDNQVYKHIHKHSANRQSFHIITISPETDFVFEGKSIKDAMQSGYGLRVIMKRIESNIFN